MSDEQPWLDTSRPARNRAQALAGELTADEKVGLLHATWAVFPKGQRPERALGSAGFTAGIPRLGIPDIQESDASLGVVNTNHARENDEATALPSSLAWAASFSDEVAHEAGALVGSEARAKGFAIQLAGGANLIREPRGGRNFEYVSEDPLLTGVISGAAIAGLQSQRVISTLKHFAVNSQETGRVVMSANIAEAALRESDLLAFEIAIGRGRPGAVMTGYNRINGEYAGEQAFLLHTVLKGDWGYPGFVMSDWGGTHSTTRAALAGLDRESGPELNDKPYFEHLGDAVREGELPAERLDDMVLRLLESLIEAGVYDDPPVASGPDVAAHEPLAQQLACRGAVLLANDGVLPIAAPRRIAAIGAHADAGVLSGGGSSNVAPAGSLEFEGASLGPVTLPRVYHPSSPVAALRAGFPGCEVVYEDGGDVSAAAAAAEGADVAIVFAEKWSTEGADTADLALPDGQDELIGAVAAAARKTVVVLEIGNPVLMPWLDAVSAVLIVWYPGAAGGPAIADLLSGKENPGGRLPISFPADLDQLPRAQMQDPSTTTSNPGSPLEGAFDVDYDIEGSDVGYRWYERTAATPLFPFGFGLSYASFEYSDLSAEVRTGGEAVVRLTVTNVSGHNGRDTPQVYVSGPSGRPRRLAGWANVLAAAGQSQTVEIPLDLRVFADYSEDLPGWIVAAGEYRLLVSTDAQTLVLELAVILPETKQSASREPI